MVNGQDCFYRSDLEIHLLAKGVIYFGIWSTFVESPPIYDIKSSTLPSDKSPKVSDKGVDLDTGKRPDPKDETPISKIRAEL